MQLPQTLALVCDLSAVKILLPTLLKNLAGANLS